MLTFGATLYRIGYSLQADCYKCELTTRAGRFGDDPIQFDSIRRTFDSIRVGLFTHRPLI